MKQVNLTIGLNDQHTKTQFLPTDETVAFITNRVADHFGGGTIFVGNWVYKHDDGTIVIEKSVRVETLMFDETIDVQAFVDQMKTDLNQESIMVQIFDIDTEFK